MRGTFDSIRICGISAAVPTNSFDNLSYAEASGVKRLKRQVSLTGIEERRICAVGQKASDLGTVAAEKLLKSIGWDPKSISVLIFVTQSGDLARPGSAFLIQNRLGLSNDCLVYDINMGCAGYVGGLITICGLLESCKGRGLLITGENNGRAGESLSYNELLEGDAASATALEYCEKTADISYMHRSDGGRANLLYKPFDKPGYMDGNAILLFGLNEVVELIKEFGNLHPEEMIDYYVFHQAQKMIIDGLIDGLNLDKDRVLYSCQKFGNTSSASIPLTIVYNLAKENVENIRLLICGYGIGLSWGVASLEVNCSNIISLIESDYIYGDREKF